MCLQQPLNLVCLGKSRDHDLDAQDRRPDAERFRRQPKSISSTIPEPRALRQPGLWPRRPRCLFFGPSSLVMGN
jgi:hypothetical protein